MQAEMAGRVALVTAAGSGIGRASAKAFATRGALVVAADIDLAAAEETAALIAADGGEAHAREVDGASETSVKDLIDFVMLRCGRLDFAHNHVGHGGPEGSIIDIAAIDFEKCFRVNTLSCFLAMKYEIPRMLQGRGGAIVNTGSVASLIGSPGLSAYVSAKHGVAGLTRTAALEFATRKIRVNAIAPGATDTPMLRGAMARFGEPNGEALKPWFEPMGRFGLPEEQAAAAVWLCSDAASFVTGQVLPVDGGHMAGNRAAE